MPVEVEVRGLNETLVYTEEFAAGFQNLALKIIKENLQDRTPVRTGRARRGWTASESGPKYRGRYLENKIPYVIYLDEGHSRQQPKGFIKRGIDAGIQESIARINEIKIERRTK
jgi:hypothetical protein